mmetsp:Transcript_33893/g.38616  ORF Transcript_33893/g.38616 Transcript_33893/m.38616 type:complete len:103 (-) Transcript_33893:222-530(-)
MMMTRNNLVLVLYVLGALMYVVEGGNETQGQFVGTEPGGETNQTMGVDYEQDQTEPAAFLFGTDDENFVKGESGSVAVASTARVAVAASIVAASAMAAVFAL